MDSVMRAYQGGPKAYRKRYLSQESAKRIQWFANLKYYAKKRGIDFDLKIEDLVVPEYCPVFPKLKLEWGVDKAIDNTISLDRIDNKKGYTKDNVRVISYRANMLKRDGELEEFIDIALYMARELMEKNNE